MTEAEWLACEDSAPLFAELCRRKQPSRVNLRRFFAELGIDWNIHADLMWGERGTFESARQAKLLRCVFGNPFRPVIFDPNWRTSTVVSLAQSMYESRDFSTTPILSDALQDAGCENEVILNHCRGDGLHVRGCWVVDLVLEKE